MNETCKDLFFGWTLEDWRTAYQNGVLQPSDLLETLDLQAKDAAWISRLDAPRLAAQLEYLAELVERNGGKVEDFPLYGVPFAVKDNIDVAGWPTTAACPEFAYEATTDATVVRRLREAGAIVVGKTNLDQFATGLVGTRSPYGVVPNTFRPEYISGGSSSGSASAVARGLVPFALGTDTAGSGRVPAGLNNIVGLKPTRGWLSTAGVVPACRTLDCVSIFALTAEDAEFITTIAGGFDEEDAYSRLEAKDATVGFPDRPRLGIPKVLEFFGDTEAASAFARALEQARAMGAEIVPIDFAPFAELASLLYQGPWVAERFAAVESLWKQSPEAIHPVVRGIVEGAANYSAADVFKAEYHRTELDRIIATVMATVDALLVPTAPTVYTIEQVLAEPLVLNARLGTYTNFANFADLCALAVPAGMRADGLPAGVTLLAPAWHDRALAAFGHRWQKHLAESETHAMLGATGRDFADHEERRPVQAANTVRLAVVGAHLRGMPLNHQLTSCGAAFVEATQTAPEYRLYALAGSVPAKPGLVRMASGEERGASIAVELWDVPVGNFGSFVAEIPPPLGIGSLRLTDGRTVKGFICEPCGLESATDITSFGGWRAYLASKQQ
ncbi:MAG: allophanate hydrolase [Acidobacteriaceae bacterium]